ncbi:MAG: type III-A CRISPR-associated protein Cas10/Csm1, partial [Desulfomonilia bacterium]
MDDTTLKIAIAGYMHDIGKFAEFGLNVSDEYLNSNAGLYQPFIEGRHTHRHAVYTAAFIDHVEKLLPSVFNKANWGLEDSFINLAAGHHLPQTPMQWLIAMADRINSGWDRVQFEDYNKAIAWKDYQKTRLLALFEGLGTDNHEPGACYPLKPLSPLSIFPGRKDEVEPSKAEDAGREYEALFEQFVFDLEGLKHREEDVSLWFEHFDSLMMIYTSCIPAARAGNVLPDVSLYDHSRVTSALATSLYLYHRDANTLNIEAIRDEKVEKFLLVTGDFHGIQSFIFSAGGEAGKNRSKILRGRSFAVSLFSELAADMLIRRIGLFCTSMVLNAAGKFTIIAPNTQSAKEAVRSCEEEINDWLLDISYGTLSMGFSSVQASPSDFTQGRFPALWDRLGTKAERKKLAKIPLHKMGVISNYLEGFSKDPGKDLAHRLCPFCGMRPSDPELEGDKSAGDRGSICRVCRDHIFLGKNLVRKDRNRIAITTADADIRGDGKLREPIFGRYQVAFLGGALNEIARSGKLLKYYDIGIDRTGSLSRDITLKFINGYVPRYTDKDLEGEKCCRHGSSSEEQGPAPLELELGAPKTFEHLACMALNEDGKGG